MNPKFKKCKEINRSSIQQLLEEFCIYPRYIKGDEALYFAPYRNDTEASMGVNYSKNVWKDYGSDDGGTIIDLLQKLYATNDIKVVLYKYNNQDRSLSCSTGSPSRKKTIINNTPKLTYRSTGKIKNPALKKYLKSRGLKPKSWDPFLEEILLKKGKHTQPAIGFKNDSGGYEIRTPKGKFCIGVKDITTIKGAHGQALLFEGFMDFLSWIEINKWKNESIIVLNSTSNIEAGITAIKRQSEIAKAEAFFDNDQAGEKAFTALKNSIPFAEDKSILYEKNKDLNEYLSSMK
ncbi:toprim domain-containing protein [Reichenbachiella sp.]|uniref:toprim domain-containing protein n=1 Tax=Reichenbachiella sp. TaxID=2184521 RepID=UPI003298FEF1